MALRAIIVSARFSIKLVYLQFKYGCDLISKHSAGVKWTLETWRGIFSAVNIWKQHKQSVCDCCSVMCEKKAKIWARRRAGLSLMWIPQVGSLPPYRHGKNRLARCAQTPLFHFLRLPCCLSNKAETNAGGLLNYERWARVILQMKSKVTGFRMSVLLEFLKKPKAFNANLRRINCLF